MLPTFSKNFADVTPGKEQAAPSTGVSVPRDGGGKRRDIRVILTWCVVIVSACAAAGMFLLNVYLDGIDFLGFTGEIQRVEMLVEEQEAAIQPQAIQDLVLFDKQIDTLRELNLSQAGYLVILETIGGIIIPSVRYTSADITLAGDVYQVKIQAVALNLPAYLQQAGVLEDSNNGIVGRMVIDQYAINRDEEGNSTVNFSMSLEVPVADTEPFMSAPEST